MSDLVEKEESTEIVEPIQSLPVATNPGQMLSMLVSQGANLETLEKFMDLQDRWEAREAKKAYVSAMNRFKAKAIVITKDNKVSYGSTNYTHATLGNICATIGAELGKEGISFRWVPKQEDQQVIITCILTHNLGHSEEATLQSGPDNSGGKNSIQAIGSAVAYLERYTLLAATGTATADQDDDGVGSNPVQDTVSDDQIENLINAARAVGEDVEYICKKAKVLKIQDLWAVRYDACLNHLKSLMEKEE